MWLSEISFHGASNLISQLGNTITLPTFTVISGWVLICDSTHSCKLYSAALLGDQFWFPTQVRLSRHWVNQSLSCPILSVPSTWLDSDKCHFYMSLIWLNYPILPSANIENNKYQRQLWLICLSWDWNSLSFRAGSLCLPALTTASHATPRSPILARQMRLL